MQTAPNNRKLAITLLVLVGLMLALSFAAVPFYRLFCQLTGFGGTAQRVAALPDPAKQTARSVSVTFNADTAADLPWHFTKPQPSTITVRLGEAVTTQFHVMNTGSQPLVGTATHNVQPERVAPWFNKVECFCFQEMVLQPGESRDLPVTFFLDADMATDATLKDIEAVTLSYTFFLAKDQSKAKVTSVK
jgi:cytochrome c oxidase assembly protein subunit 11